MEPLLITFLLQSCRVGVVALAIFLIRGLFGRRLSPTVRHALWLFAVAAMILPLRIPIPVHETAKNLPVSEAPALSAQSFQEPRITPMPIHEPANYDVLPQPVAWEITPEIQSKNSHLPTFSQVCFALSGIWLGGVVFLFGMSVRQIMLFRRRIGDMKPITDEQTLSVLNECRQKMRIAKTVGLWESDRIASPLLMGLFMPRILLPKRLSRSLTAEQLTHLLMHELAHVRRHDILTGWLLSLLGMVHWFNPLIVFAVRTANRDSEEAADALAITRMTPQGRIEYGMTLLHLAANRPLSPLPTVPGLAGILESSSKLSRRIEMIKRHKKTGRLAALLAVTFCTLACLGAFCQLKIITAEETPKNDNAQIVAEESKEKEEEMPESAALKKFDRDKYVPIRGRVIVPEGKTLGRASLLMRALSSDNEQGLYGSNESIQSDGTFLMQAHANANYEIVVNDRENPTLTSKTYRLEVGDEAPKEEIVIPLVEATAMIEGRVIDAQTGKPLPEMGLIFFQYFEVKSKNDGKPLTWPITYYIMTDRDGKFRQGVLPGNYGVAIQSDAMKLFFNPRTGYPKNYWTTSWDENKPTTFTAFQVKEGETVKPILRIPHDSKDIRKEIAIYGKIVLPDGQKMPESIKHLSVRILTHDNNTNYGMQGGIVRQDGSFYFPFKSNMNYEMTVYDENNEWAAKPIYVEVGADSPSDEYEITLEKGTLIEGTALDHATGKPLVNTTLWFFEYFEVNSKTTGEKRRYPINSPLVTDFEGKFRRAVLPGLYGISTEMAATTLFMPSTIEKLTVTDPADWEKNEERQATAFEVKSNGETVRPILRIAK